MKRKAKNLRTGAATVEFAVIAPVFVLLVLGMIELGRGINVQHVLLNASRAACRVAIIEGATQQDIASQVDSSLAGSGISSYSLLVSPTPLSSAAAGDPVTVTLSASYANVSWIPVPKYMAGATVSGSCSLPHE